VILGILLGLLYFDTENNQAGVNNKNGAVFFMMLAAALPSCMDVINTIPAGLPLYYREYTNAMYSPSAYFISLTMTPMLLQIVSTAILATLFYWLVDINDTPARYLIFMLILILFVLAAYSWGYLISTAAGSYQLASIIAPNVIFPFALFAGFFMVISSVPAILLPFVFTSFFTPCWEGLAVLTWRNVPISCNPDEETCVYDNGNEVLDYYGLDNSVDGVWTDVWLLVLEIVLVRALSLFCLWRRSIRAKQSAIRVDQQLGGAM